MAILKEYHPNYKSNNYTISIEQLSDNIKIVVHPNKFGKLDVWTEIDGRLSISNLKISHDRKWILVPKTYKRATMVKEEIKKEGTPREYKLYDLQEKLNIGIMTPEEVYEKLKSYYLVKVEVPEDEGN